MLDFIKGQQKLFGEMYGQVFDLYKGLVDPEEIPKANVDEAMEFFDKISDKYESTLGKAIKMMNMGINLETYDEQQKAVGEPTECALVDYAAKLGMKKPDLKAATSSYPLTEIRCLDTRIWSAQ